MSFNPNKVTSNLKRGDDQALPSNIFSVMIGGEIIGSFLKVTGLEYSVSPFQIKEGGRNYSPHMRPFDGPGQHGELTLEWGAMKRDKMEAWIQSVAPGFPFRRNVFISHNQRDGTPFRFTILFGAWPKQWRVGDLDATGNALATESVTLVYEGMAIVPASKAKSGDLKSKGSDIVDKSF